MPRGLALTIGLNAVDPKHYQGWSGELNACEADAGDMADIAKSNKFNVKTLLTKAATRAQVTSQISKAATSLKQGDIFLLTYSGHGGQVPDLNDYEEDGKDETWCLYDGQLVDDEIYALLGKFAKGVRIFVLSDSCHSGSVVKVAYYQGTVSVRNANIGQKEARYRFMPHDVALRTYRRNMPFYDKILKNPALKNSRMKVMSSALLISGCQDNQYSSDGDFNGLFTANLLRVWDNGNFNKGYRQFRNAIVKRMPPDQTPNYFRVGVIDRAFEAQKPFSI